MSHVSGKDLRSPKRHFEQEIYDSQPDSHRVQHPGQTGLMCIAALAYFGTGRSAISQIVQSGDSGPGYDGSSNPWILPGQLSVGDTAIGSVSVTGAYEIQSASGSMGANPGG